MYTTASARFCLRLLLLAALAVAAAVSAASTADAAVTQTIQFASFSVGDNGTIVMPSGLTAWSAQDADSGEQQTAPDEFASWTASGEISFTESFNGTDFAGVTLNARASVFAEQGAIGRVDMRYISHFEVTASTSYTLTGDFVVSGGQTGNGVSVILSRRLPTSGIIQMVAVGGTSPSQSFNFAGTLPPATYIFQVLVDPTAGGGNSAQFELDTVLSLGATPITVSIGDAVDLEGGPGAGPTLNFPVSLSGPAPAGGVSVTYGTADGSAQAGTDYTATSGTVTFNQGEQLKSVPVSVSGDSETEPDETFSVNLSSPSGATIADGTGAGTILNDEASVNFDWGMPDRHGLDDNGDGMMDYRTTAASISPSRWRVDFRYAAFGECDPSALLTIEIDGVNVSFSDTALVALNTATCTFSYAFAAEDKYAVTVELSGPGGTVLGQTGHDVIVQDWLIISLGDSVASGEGNPDIPGLPRWQNRQCHRSAFAGPSQAALSLEQLDRRTSVTFVHLACSGASMFQGVAGPYRGQEFGPLLPAQIEQMDALVGRREIDAVFLSVGANDLGFRTIVQGCFLQRNCHLAMRGSMKQFFDSRITGLPSSFDALGLVLRASRYDVMASRVYITEYHDPTRDDRGDFCHEKIFEESVAIPFFGISGAEAQWASNEMLARLNSTVEAAATRNGWNFIGKDFSGLARLGDAFLVQGYCSPLRKVVQLRESLVNQGDADGALHPNAEGHLAYAAWIAGNVAQDFFPGTDTTPREPR